MKRRRARPGTASLRAALAAALVAVGLAGGLVAATSVGADVAAAKSPEWRVIVHPTNPTRSLTRAHLDRIYRRRVRFWPDGSPVLAVNLPGGDPLRREFTLEVMRDDEDDLATFWNRQYFQGVAPPTVLQSSKAVRAFVAATPNAIGYVAAEDVEAGVAVVEVRDEP